MVWKPNGLKLDILFNRNMCMKFDGSLAIYNFTAMVKKYGKSLPWWELLEAKLYPKIWYVGTGVYKTPYNETDPLNYGFDKYTDSDEREAKLKIVSCHNIYIHRINIINIIIVISYCIIQV